MTIKERIKSLRMAKSIKQSDFAKMINISQGAYSNIEGGDTELSIERLEKIAEALGVSVKFLLFGEEETLNDNEKMMVEMLQQRIKDLENTIKDKDKIIKLLENK